MDACWPEAHLDMGKMVSLATIKIPFDVNIIPEMMGCKVHGGRKDSQKSGSE